VNVVLSLFHEPAPPLRELVEHLWLFSDVPPHARERIVPSGTFELVINLEDDEIRIYDSPEARHSRRFSGALLSGAYSTFFVIDTQVHASIMGVHFKPGGAHPFLDWRADELSDSHVDLDAVWGPAAELLRERLCEARTAADRFELLERALVERLGDARTERGRVQYAIERLADGAKVATTADEVGLCHRRFIQVFSGEVGMTPKVFGRVQRFQRALSLMKCARSPSWAELATHSGYSDQSHMIREFVALSGLSPADYFCLKSERVKVNHVPLAAADGARSDSRRDPRSGSAYRRDQLPPRFGNEHRPSRATR
jgi:AraC-like DNA-binding protein